MNKRNVDNIFVKSEIVAMKLRKECNLLEMSLG